MAAVSYSDQRFRDVDVVLLPTLTTTVPTVRGGSRVERCTSASVITSSVGVSYANFPACDFVRQSITTVDSGARAPRQRRRRRRYDRVRARKKLKSPR
jgi:hypothetical protein